MYAKVRSVTSSSNEFETEYGISNIDFLCFRPTPDVTTVLLNEDCLVRWEGNGVKKASGERAKVRALLFGAVWVCLIFIIY